MRKILATLLIVVVVSFVAIGDAGFFYMPDKSAQTVDALRSALVVSWKEAYQINVFDCSNMATFVAAYLQEVKGFDTEVVFSEKQNHAWVKVKNVGGRDRIVEATGFTLGYIVDDALLYGYGAAGGAAGAMMTKLGYTGAINYNLYNATYEWYEFMNRWEKLYIDLHRKYTRLIKQYNELVGKYNRLGG